MKKMCRMNLSVTPEWYEKLEYVARQMGVSKNQLCVMLVAQALHGYDLLQKGVISSIEDTNEDEHEKAL